MNNRKLRIFTYLGALFMTVASSFPAYVNSSFLAKFLNERGVSIVYIIASLPTIFLMLNISRLVRKIGNIATIVILSGLSITTLLVVIFGHSPILIISAFILYYCLWFLIRFALDVYLENISDNNDTGLIRGVYLTFFNLAYLISPFLAGQLAGQGEYGKIYGVAAFALAILMIIAIFFLRESKIAKSNEHGLWRELKYLWQSTEPKARNLYRILLIDFLLNFFYAVMVIYMPLYLYNHIGLSWKEIGLAFTIMLLPFVLFELPLGRIADKFTGEKEILLGGIIVCGLATMIVPFIYSLHWFIWAIILFATRTGAAAIEITKESYLFKKLDGRDTDIISLSRMSVPFAYLVGPIFASLVFVFFDFKYIFLALGLVMLLGLRYASGLKDTR